MLVNFNRVTEKVKLVEKINHPPTEFEQEEIDFEYYCSTDTREFRTCPHCRGSGNHTDHIDPGILVLMPCAGCDGRGEVLDGIGYNADANEWECWVWGELYWARSETIAARMYRENLAMFQRHFCASIMKIPF